MARLRHRIPVRLRHHWKLVAACVAFLAACYGVLGSGTVRPYVTSVRTASAGGVVVRDLAGSKELFDAAAPHEVALTFRDESYQDMLAEYFKDGDKKYVEADLTIDGTTIPSVGIRLKGNSTLRGLTWKGQTRPRDTTGGENPPEGARPPGGEPPEGVKPPQDGPPDGPQGGKRRAALKAEEPEKLPWLISFDEFVEGRRYQGHSQLAVRPTMESVAVLNEAVAIASIAAAGEPSQRSAYASFSVNGRHSAPRLLVEYLDEGYAERLGDGVLYKSLATGTFTYKGEDQTAYADDFKQVNQVGQRDLQPVIDLVRWVEQASDEEFAKGLAERLDVVSFARYAALQNILLNGDDMAGPGHNYYLWYDLGAERFRVISWDMNLALRGDATAGPHDGVGMKRTRGRPGAGKRPQQQGRPPQKQHVGPRGGHALKERFLKDAGFKELYEREHAALTRDLLAGGTATTLLDQALKAYGLNAGADRARAAEEAAGLRATLETRAESLAS